MVAFLSRQVILLYILSVTTEQESRYVVETADRQYEQAIEVSTVQDSDHCDKTVSKRQKSKEDENFWDRHKVKLLLTLCLENKNVDKEMLWEEISGIIGATPDECNTKYRHLRRTYLRLLKKKRMGRDVKWVHYGICEEVFTDLKALPPSVLEPWEDNKVRRLLTLYIDNLHRFRNPNCLQKDVWKEMAVRLGTTSYNCYHKFKNLRRSYLTWLNRSRETGKGIKWPYYHYFERIYHNYNPNTRPWDRNKIKVLLEAYAQIAYKFRNPKLQKKELWKEISQKVGETPSACDKKFRNLKQTYVRLKKRAHSGRLTTKWRYYRDFEVINSYTTRYIDLDGQKIVYRTGQDENYIHHLLSFYIDNKEKFRDPLTKNKTLWRLIGPKLGLTAGECDKKFRNLKQTYIRLAWKKKQTGKCTSWPYYRYFEAIYDEPVGGAVYRSRVDIDDVMRCEIRRAVRDVYEQTETDRKFERLVQVAEESNNIQRERNAILQGLLNKI